MNVFNNFLNFSQSELKKITGDDKISGIIVTILHFIIIVSILYLLIMDDNKYALFIVTIALIIVYLLHLYFNGCILLKLERHLFQNKNWFGIYTILPYLGISINPQRIKNIVDYGLLPFWSTIYLYKLNQLMLLV